MNYVEIDTAFERWCENNYLPIISQAIWKKLFKRFNRSGWSEWVTVDNLTLMAEVQTSSEKTFILYRDKLIEARLVEQRKGKKGFPNQYKLLPIINTVVSTSFSTVQINTSPREVQSTVQSTVETTVQSTDINKHKQNQTETKTREKRKDLNKIHTSPHKSSGKSDPAILRQCIELYEIYPKKQGREKALQYIKRDIEAGEECEVIRHGVNSYRHYIGYHRTEQQYIPMASTFFNQRRWRDDWTVVVVEQKPRTVHEKNREFLRNYLGDEYCDSQPGEVGFAGGDCSEQTAGFDMPRYPIEQLQ